MKVLKLIDYCTFYDHGVYTDFQTHKSNIHTGTYRGIEISHISK